MKKIDYRSDTAAKPTKAMRQAIYSAEVGDDVLREDPTVNELEAISADLLGKEAALFVSTGTQGNLISILAHCERGEEYIAGLQSHLYLREAGGPCVLGGVYPHPLENEADGTLDLNKVKKAIKPNDSHFAKTKLLALENTLAGKILPLDYLEKVATFTRLHHLNSHLDGARIFNASIALNIPVNRITNHFDSVTFCLSKGLGAPAGSIICASKDFIEKARRLRKMLGGGMRQAGILAAAGLYALKNNVSRLSEDHQHATHLAKELSTIDQLAGKIRSSTNMVFITVGPEGLSSIPEFLRYKGILVYPGETIRFALHLDISRDDVETTIKAFKEFYSSSSFHTLQEQHASLPLRQG